MLQSSWKTLSLPHSPPSWQPRERERDDCLLKSYLERIQSLDFPRTRDATSLSAESGCEVEELSRARERDPRECPQTPEKLSIRRNPSLRSSTHSRSRRSEFPREKVLEFCILR